MKTKKPLVVVVLTLAIVILVVLLPSSAVAKTGPITYELPAFFGIFWDQEGLTPPGPDVTWGFVPEAGYPRDPRVGDSMSLYYGWSTFNRGTAQTAPDYTILGLWVDGPGDYDIGITPAQAKSYWEQPFIVDPPENQPFNPSIGAEQWAAYWRYVIDLKVPGIYKVHFFQDFTRTNNDLTALWDDGTEQWLDKFAGHILYAPGDGVGDSYFTFVVKR
jgi:hypothetical protein